MVNPTLELAKRVSLIDKTQNAVADLQSRMDAAILAESGEDISALRLEITKTKALLGELRNEEAFWRQEVKENQNDRKNQNELTKG